ncbi:MAG: HEAT repeat domain-containing protein [Candidatus Thorarchaeota archaeon]
MIRPWEIELAYHSQFWNLQAIDELVDKKLAEEGWQTVVQAIRYLPFATLYKWKSLGSIDVIRTKAFDAILKATPWAIYDPVRTQPMGKGRVDDIRNHILGLDTIPGIESHISEFLDIRPTNLDELREQAIPIAIELLTAQIGRGDTFFLSPDKMALGPFAGFIPDVLEARVNEIQKLPKEPGLAEIIETYYGFKMFSESENIGNVGSVQGVVKHQSVDAFCEFAGTLGKYIVNPKEELSLTSLFRKRRVYYHDTLMNILRAMVGSGGGLTYLGREQDSKALDALHSRLIHAGSVGERRAFLEAIGSIGHPYSFEVVSGTMDDESLWPEVFATMSRIRHPEAFDAIEPFIGESAWIKEKMFSLARTRDERAISYLEARLLDQYLGLREAAIDGLVLFGPKGIDVLRRYMNDDWNREHFEEAFLELEL